MLNLLNYIMISLYPLEFKNVTHSNQVKYYPTDADHEYCYISLISYHLVKIYLKKFAVSDCITLCTINLLLFSNSYKFWYSPYNVTSFYTQI